MRICEFFTKICGIICMSFINTNLIKKMSIIWKPEYSVGVKEIDAQHQRLVELINQTYDSVYKNSSKDETLKIVQAVLDHGILHFKTEEKYFDKFHYPLAEEHKKEHVKLLANASSFKTKINDSVDYKKETMNFLDFLEDWLVDHMMVQDKKYSVFFNQNGLY